MTADLFMDRDAVMGENGKYRYLLRRAWDPKRPRALLVMLNPSTADAEIDDPTIRSCIRLCRSWGHGSFEVVNVYAFRATDPKALRDADDPVGPQNDDVIAAAINRCDVVICAWGAHTISQSRRNDILSAVRQRRPVAYCMGKTKAGHPKHPLYIKSGTPLEVYR